MVDALRFRSFLVSVPLILGLSASLACAARDGQKVSEAFPRLSSGALASAKLATLPKGVVMKSGNLVLKQTDLNAEIRESREDMWPQLKRNLFYVLESAATRVLLAAEAKAWAKTKDRPVSNDQDELIGDYLRDLTSGIAVTDEEINEFYEKNKVMFGKTTLDEARNDIRDFMANDKKSEFVNGHVNTISERTAVVVDTAWTTKQNSAAMDNPVDKARGEGMPLLVDFGSDGCKPCAMMTPILDELTKKYVGKVKVLFVHVGKDPVLGARYGIRSIPVQAFYDKNGDEVFRHVGFFPQDEIEAKLAEMGVK